RTSYLDGQVTALKSDLEDIRQHEADLQASTVLDLGNYSPRVIGIGEAEKLSSEAIQKDSGESEWLPQNFIYGSANLSQFTSDNTDATTELLDQRIQHAEAEGESFVLHPESNVSIPLDDAKKLLNDLRDSKSDDLVANDIEQEQPKADETKKKSTL